MLLFASFLLSFSLSFCLSLSIVQNRIRGRKAPFLFILNVFWTCGKNVDIEYQLKHVK